MVPDRLIMAQGVAVVKRSGSLAVNYTHLLVAVC